MRRRVIGGLGSFLTTLVLGPVGAGMGAAAMITGFSAPPMGRPIATWMSPSGCANWPGAMRDLC